MQYNHRLTINCHTQCYSICFAATTESKRSTIGRGAIKSCQKLRRKWVALRENYFDVWCSRNTRANRITNAQWWARILSRSLFLIRRQKSGKIKQNTRPGLCVCVRMCADRVRSCGGNVGWMRNKNIPAFDLSQIFFAIRKKMREKT